MPLRIEMAKVSKHFFSCLVLDLSFKFQTDGYNHIVLLSLPSFTLTCEFTFKLIYVFIHFQSS